MSVTADLPPGARSRMWILLALTSLIGVGTFWAFGRKEILWIAGLVLLVLIYLLLGVWLTRKQEKRALVPILEQTLADFGKNVPWALLDRNGTVLFLSACGRTRLGHSELLVGQRFSDLVPAVPLENRVRFLELLRFVAAGKTWRGRLQWLGEDGTERNCTVGGTPPRTRSAQRLGLVALSEAAPVVPEIAGTAPPR